MSTTEEEEVGRMVIDRGNIIMYIILTSRPRLLVVMGNVSQFRHFVKSYEISWYKQNLNTFLFCLAPSLNPIKIQQHCVIHIMPVLLRL